MKPANFPRRRDQRRQDAWDRAVYYETTEEGQAARAARVAEHKGRGRKP